MSKFVQVLPRIVWTLFFRHSANWYLAFPVLCCAVGSGRVFGV